MNFSELLPETIFEATERLGGRCTGRFLGLNAMENRVYDIEMEGEPSRIAKFYRPQRWDRDTILGEHAFLFKAVEEEIPVVAPLKNPNGESLFETQGIFFALFPKKPGRLEPELNPKQLERLGRYLARLHNVGESLSNIKRTSLTPQTYGADSLRILEEASVFTGSLGAHYSKLVDDILKTISPLFQNIETILLHGDCHAGNVLWNGDEPYFIDFDDMVFAPPVQDFWMLLGGDDDYAKKNLEILLKSYEEIRSFDDSTLKLIEPLRALRLIYFSAWIARRKDDGAFKAAFPHFGTERYWQEQVEILSGQLEKLRHHTPYGV